MDVPDEEEVRTVNRPDHLALAARRSTGKNPTPRVSLMGTQAMVRVFTGKTNATLWQIGMTSLDRPIHLPSAMSPSLPAAPPSPPLLSLQGVTKRFFNVVALADVHFDVRAG